MIPSCSLLMKVGAGGGGSSADITLSNQTITKVGNGTGTITTAYHVTSAGTVTNQAGTVLETWLHNGKTNSAYEIQATLTSGDTPTGTLNSFLNLGGTSAGWTLTAGAGIIASCVLAMTIRDVATHTTQATANITLDSENA